MQAIYFIEARDHLIKSDFKKEDHSEEDKKIIAFEVRERNP